MNEILSYYRRITSFTPNARLFLVASFTGALYHSVFNVLGNLYIMQAGLTESFLGTMISVSSFTGLLFAMPAGILSDRIGRRKAMLCASLIVASAQLTLILFPVPHIILMATLLGGAGGALMMVSGSPFLMENSTTEERSHLFSVTHAMWTVSGIGGSFLGGSLPLLWGRILSVSPTSMAVYRNTLLSAFVLLAISALPIVLVKEAPRIKAQGTRKLMALSQPLLVGKLIVPELLTAFGAGLIVPFFNVYFTNHLKASPVHVGIIFSVQSLVTTVAVLWAPVLGQRYGKVGAIVRTNLLGIPVMLFMALSGNLWLVAIAAWLRSALANMCNPLWQAFNMEVLDARERATVSSMLGMAWSLGWGVSAAAGGYIMQNYSYTLPYYITIVLYLLSAFLMHHFFADKESELVAAIAD